MNTKSTLMVAAALTCSILGANAALVSTGPFTGAYSETFESFPNYNTGPFYQTEPFDIMGGFAAVTSDNTDMVIYEPGLADFGLASGSAMVADGSKGLGFNSSETATITFDSPVSAFGGYFGSANGFGWDGEIDFSFSDGSTASFIFSGQALTWQGWNSDVGISSVTINGDYLVMDGLQANSSGSHPLPDGGMTITMLGIACSGLGLLRPRR